jgi:hypothetical protein
MKKLLAAALAAALVPQSANAALIGLYQFNDAADLGRDSSGASNHASNNGASFANAGYQGGAASFQGTSWLTAPINVAAGARPKLSWGAWAKPAAGGGSQQALLSSDNGDFDRQLMIDSRSGTAWSALTGTGVLSSGEVPSTSGWTFIAGVYDQTLQKMTFYVNGESYNADTAFGPSLDVFTIGRNATFTEYFSGLIDNVFVYDEALSGSDIARIREQGFPAASVPEPETWAMLLVGFGLVGAMTRRRSATRTVAL